ncbi:hypothetical protein [Pseudobacteriovorax antillogorgiicola]|uniref:Uncharacterized protein n=1 Tax=Pseudobacteriovorax antillogorgiicola TaxID=1513793 RepID=A0A1Y6BKF8_9BACT|nr:hypothetical protein [Pseudobacteriovorax antillogorgiicola]TCS55298.1 hypothetical protein EDD56_10519 [Pseudobacteriovorax antillogorgiicola]SMF14508.1 hypothetical protein SAMN06296036_105305 [Pseudobacteriovorax antillogorgiicola]
MERVWIIAGIMSSQPLAAANVDVVEERAHRETRRFCSEESQHVAVKACQTWLAAQKKNLGTRLLTAYCSHEAVRDKAYGCTFRSVGQLKYVLKTYRIEMKDGP